MGLANPNPNPNPNPSPDLRAPAGHARRDVVARPALLDPLEVELVELLLMLAEDGRHARLLLPLQLEELGLGLGRVGLRARVGVRVRVGVRDRVRVSIRVWVRVRGRGQG